MSAHIAHMPQQEQYDDIVRCTDDLLDKQEESRDVIELARRAIDKAKFRARTNAGMEQELKLAEDNHSQLLRSPAHRHGMARVTQALTQLPELVLRSLWVSWWVLLLLCPGGGGVTGGRRLLPPLG